MRNKGLVFVVVLAVGTLLVTAASGPLILLLRQLYDVKLPAPASITDGNGLVWNAAGKYWTNGSTSLGGSNTFSGATLFNGPFMLMATNLASGTVIDYNSKPVQIMTLTGNTTITSLNERSNVWIKLIAKQDATGGRLLTFNFTGPVLFQNSTNQSTSTPTPMPTNANIISSWDIYNVEGTNWIYGPSSVDSKLLTDLINNNALTNTLLVGVTFSGQMTNSGTINGGTYSGITISGGTSSGGTTYSQTVPTPVATATNFVVDFSVPEVIYPATNDIFFRNTTNRPADNTTTKYSHWVITAGAADRKLQFNTGVYAWRPQGGSVMTSQTITAGTSADVVFSARDASETNVFVGVTLENQTTSVYTGYAAGTAYTTTATPALAHLGTTDPTITIANAGTYLLLANAGVKYSSATYAGAQTITVKLRKTSGSAADVTSATRTVELPVLTTFTGGDSLSIPPVTYTATAGDIVQLWVSVSALPSAGSVVVDSAEVAAVRLY